MPATSGVISRVLASEEMTPVKAWAPIWGRPVNPSRPTSVPVKKAMLTTTKNIPPPDHQRAGADGDVGHQHGDLLAVAQRPRACARTIRP